MCPDIFAQERKFNLACGNVSVTRGSYFEELNSFQERKCNLIFYAQERKCNLASGNVRETRSSRLYEELLFHRNVSVT